MRGGIPVKVPSHLCPAAPASSTGGRINSGCCTGSRLGAWQGNHPCCQVCISTAHVSGAEWSFHQGLASKQGTICLHPLCNPSFQAHHHTTAIPHLKPPCGPSFLLLLRHSLSSRVRPSSLYSNSQIPGIFHLFFFLSSSKRGRSPQQQTFCGPLMGHRWVRAISLQTQCEFWLMAGRHQ